jgi:hypothetical protein
MPNSAWLCVLSCTAFVAAAHGQAVDAGRVKRLQGAVTLQRGEQAVPLQPGTVVQVGDRLVTGRDGAVGLTLADDTRLTAGPSSTLVLGDFSFDPTTHEGRLRASLLQGTLHMVSGAIAKQAPQNVQVQTPHALLGVRGTEFIVDARDSKP